MSQPITFDLDAAAVAALDEIAAAQSRVEGTAHTRDTVARALVLNALVGLRAASAGGAAANREVLDGVGFVGEQLAGQLEQVGADVRDLRRAVAAVLANVFVLLGRSKEEAADAVLHALRPKPTG